MFCRNCGKELDDEVKFCPECGAKTRRVGENIDNNATPAQPVQPVADGNVYQQAVSNDNIIKPKSKLMIALIAAAAVVCALAVVLVIMLTKGNNSPKSDSETVANKTGTQEIDEAEQASSNNEVVPILLQNGHYTGNSEIIRMDFIVSEDQVDVRYTKNGEFGEVFGSYAAYSDGSLALEVDTLRTDTTILDPGIVDALTTKAKVLSETELDIGSITLTLCEQSGESFSGVFQCENYGSFSGDDFHDFYQIVTFYPDGSFLWVEIWELEYTGDATIPMYSGTYIVSDSKIICFISQMNTGTRGEPVYSDVVKYIAIQASDDGNSFQAGDKTFRKTGEAQ